MRYPDYIERHYQFPRFYRIAPRFPRPRIDSIPHSVREAMARQWPESGIKAGDKIGIGVGSRGIRNITEITRLICQEIRDRGASPFLLPAMGSHGGVTSQGQEKILAALGITPQNCDCPILSGMEVRRIATVFGEVPVYYAKDALDMDSCICVNRIKPHTKFKGAVESGIAKMLCVGMGKHMGALTYHRWALQYGFSNLLTAWARKAVSAGNFRFGIGIVENGYDETCRIESVSGDRLIEEEKELLTSARYHLPQLPVQSADVLLVKRIGKEISGSGMDPNMTGRTNDLMENDFSENFQCKRLAILNLSPKSQGNGLGIGNADFITDKVYQNLDYETTVMNALTSFSIRKAAIPVRLPTDEKVLQACFTTIGPVPANQVEAILIRDTLDISNFLVSQKLLKKLEGRADLQIGESLELEFDVAGNIVSL